MPRVGNCGSEQNASWQLNRVAAGSSPIFDWSDLRALLYLRLYGHDHFLPLYRIHELLGLAGRHLASGIALPLLRLLRVFVGLRFLPLLLLVLLIGLGLLLLL